MPEYQYLDLLTLVKDQLEGRESEIDRALFSYFSTLEAQAQGASFSHNPPRPVEVLDATIRKIESDAQKESGIFKKGATGFASFFLVWASELREIICGKGKKPPKLKTETQGIIAALAALISQQLGVSNPTAVGIAVLILLALAQATRNTFCKMTDTEVYKAVRAALEGKPRE